MTSEEFRDAIKALGMNGVQAASFLWVSPSAVSRYASGENQVPGPVAKLLEEALAEHAEGGN